MSPAKRKKKKTSFPRRSWPRSPVQKPHSTKKGKKGYSRTRIKKQTRQEGQL